jgi:hypothetical protein
MAKEYLKDSARLLLPLYRFESETIKFIYAGYSSIKKKYYDRLIFGRSTRNKFLGLRCFWMIPSLIRDYNLDMAIAEISPMVLRNFQGYSGYIIPEWEKMRINIDLPLNEICRPRATHFSDVKRLIRKYNLTYEILSDIESFNFFHFRMYLPYVTKRHGGEAWIEDLQSYLNSTPPPELMTIKENGRIVGGVVISKTEDSILLLRLGLLDGNEEYRRHGVIGAIYYFGVLEGQKMALKYVDVGGARPFLSDNLTRFKIGLGAKFVSDLSPTKEYLWLGVNPESSAAMEFMQNVMHIDKNFNLIRFGT